MILKTRQTVNGIKGLKLIFYTNEIQQSEYEENITKILEDCDLNYRIYYNPIGITINYNNDEEVVSIRGILIPEENIEENVEKNIFLFFYGKIKKGLSNNYLDLFLCLS